MQFDSGRGQIVNYGLLRVALTVLSGIVQVALIGFLITLIQRDNFAPTIFAILDGLLLGIKNRLFLVQGILILLTIFLAECFLLTYLAIPVPMRPILAWAAITSFLGWLVLRLVYASEYARRLTMIAWLKWKWKEWIPVQQKTFVVLVLMSLVYFIGFMPSNYKLDSEGRFYTHSDETIIYPDVARVLVWQGNFSDMVHVVVESWPWWYGYPYLPISAAVLLVPRLVMGNDFTSNIQLNIFLLRQFVSVLPMVLSILLLIYLAN